jgi:pilus assembly protein CpaD
MRLKLGLVLLASTVAAGCSTSGQPVTDAGLSAVNVPVISRATYVFDAAAPYCSLSPADAARLNAWFNGLDLRYGDVIYVDGAGPEARADVARIAGNYGLLVSSGAPVTAGAVVPGTVRVIVSRAEASVPGCPNWHRDAQPNFENRMMPNFGCAVNSNLAAMVANPEDLIHGREGSGVGDAATAARAIGIYRTTPPTGTQGLQDISTKKDEQ